MNNTILKAPSDQVTQVKQHGTSVAPGQSECNPAEDESAPATSRVSSKGKQQPVSNKQGGQKGTKCRLCFTMVSGNIVDHLKEAHPRPGDNQVPKTVSPQQPPVATLSKEKAPARAAARRSVVDEALQEEVDRFYGLAECISEFFKDLDTASRAGDSETVEVLKKKIDAQVLHLKFSAQLLKSADVDVDINVVIEHLINGVSRDSSQRLHLKPKVPPPKPDWKVLLEESLAKEAYETHLDSQETPDVSKTIFTPVVSADVSTPPTPYGFSTVFLSKRDTVFVCPAIVSSRASNGTTNFLFYVHLLSSLLLGVWILQLLPFSMGSWFLDLYVLILEWLEFMGVQHQTLMWPLQAFQFLMKLNVTWEDWALYPFNLAQMVAAISAVASAIVYCCCSFNLVMFREGKYSYSNNARPDWAREEKGKLNVITVYMPLVECRFKLIGFHALCIFKPTALLSDQ